jgi:hypothetical protein
VHPAKIQLVLTSCSCSCHTLSNPTLVDAVGFAVHYVLIYLRISQFQWNAAVTLACRMHDVKQAASCNLTWDHFS